MDSFGTTPADAATTGAEPADRSPAAFLARAVDLATRSVRHQGGPFGAIVVSADGRVFEGVNRVTADLDPTAHAEVSAIRAACQGLGTFDLTGATLYSSCEPCPMCLSSALWARIERVYFAASRHDAAAAGFDDALFHRYFEDGSDVRAIMPLVSIEVGDDRRVEPFTAWTNSPSRIDY